METVGRAHPTIVFEPNNTTVAKERYGMEELFELKAHIEQGRYIEALTLIGEMEEMGRDDKINKVRSFTVILLLHLIKKHAEPGRVHSMHQ